MGYAIGDRVRRIEQRAQVGATVEQIEQDYDGAVLLLIYDEGGGGWWPVTAVEPEPLP